MIIILWTFAQPVTVNSCFLKRASQDALTSVNTPLSTNQTTSLQKNHASTEYVNPLTFWKSTLSPFPENISHQLFQRDGALPALLPPSMYIGFGFQAVSGENDPLSNLKCWNFIFLLGLCLLGAGVEGKEGSVTAEEQMKSTLIPNLMYVRLSPIC